MAFRHGTPNSIVTDGLVFYVDAANPKSYPGSGTTAFNLTNIKTFSTYNQSTNGTISGATFEHENAGVWNFDGSGDKITFGQVKIPNVSVSCWLKPVNVTNTKSIWCTGTSQYNNYQLLINADDILIFDDISNANDSLYSTPYTMNEWVNVVVIKNSSNVNTMYINGVQVGTGDVGSNKNWSDYDNNNVQIGFSQNFNFFTGKISNWMLYQKELSAAEVLQNYNALKNRFRT